MKKLLVIAISLVLVFSLVVPVSAAKVDKGFNDAGYNYNARIFNGFYQYAPDMYLVMKWSKDWTPMADEPVGAWCTNHSTWYSGDYDEDTWYGYTTMTAYGTGAYKVEEFSKIMRVSDDAAAWAVYQAAGAYDAGWGTYTDGVPKYVVFQDNISVYDAVTGTLVFSDNLVEGGVCKTLGQPIF